MRWFYILLAAIVVAGAALAVDRVMRWHREFYVQAIVAVALVVIFIALFAFLSKLRD